MLILETDGTYDTEPSTRTITQHPYPGAVTITHVDKPRVFLRGTSTAPTTNSRVGSKCVGNIIYTFIPVRALQNVSEVVEGH